jgi:hypothetical protein
MDNTEISRIMFATARLCGFRRQSQMSIGTSVSSRTLVRLFSVGTAIKSKAECPFFVDALESCASRINYV